VSESIVLWLIAAWSIAGGWLIVGSAWPAQGHRAAAIGAKARPRADQKAESAMEPSAT
jgi:hypothetical protein